MESGSGPRGLSWVPEITVRKWAKHLGMVTSTRPSYPLLICS